MSAFGIGDADYLAWLSRPDRRRCLLVEVEADTPAGTVTRYLSNTGYVTAPGESPANTVYLDRITGAPDFEAKLSELFGGRSSFGVGNVDLDNSDGALDAWLDDGWDGRPLRVFIGDPEWRRADFRRVLSGICQDIIAGERGRLSLQLRDKTGALNVPIQTALVGGTTANANQLKPIALGASFNVEPVLIDAATHTYQVHDGAIQGVSAVRDNGLGVAFSVNAAAGTFTLNAAPVGRITADVAGALVGGVFLTTAAAIASHLITTRSTLTAADLDAASFTAHAALCPQPLGLFIRDRRNLVDVLDELLTSVGSWWSPDRQGLIRVGRLDAPAGTPVLDLSDEDIEVDQIAIARRILPPASIRLGYARNWTPQPDGLAGAVTEANRALYAAGSQIASATQSLPRHRLAPNPEVAETLLTVAADATTEAARRLALAPRVRTVVRITAFARPLYVRLGDVLRLTHPRFGFAAGQLAIVVGLRDRVLEDRTEIELWH